MLLIQLFSNSNINNNNILNQNYIPIPSFNKNNISNYNSNFINIGKKNNTLLNKKTSRKEEKNTKENLTSNNKNKIFKIIKIEDREKEDENEKIKKCQYRGSRYRGVSRNGKTWQVLIMANRKKKYIGNLKSEVEAAKIYDEYAMKFHKNKARLNFFHQGFVKYVNKP